MELDKILEAAKEAGLNASVLDAIKGLDKSADVERLTKELDAEKGKAAGILEDKKKYKERAEKAEGDLKKIADEKLPEDERHKKELQELKERLESEKADRERQAAEFAKTQREAKIADLTGSVKWADGVPHGTSKLIVQNALAEIEDLSDKSKVEDALKNLKESHKSLIAADAPSGTGGKNVEDRVPKDDKKEFTLADAVKESWAK